MTENTVTKDLMIKISQDITAAMMRTLALTDNHLPVAIAGGSAAAGIIAGCLGKMSGAYDKEKGPDEENVMLAGLLIARMGSQHPDAIAQAYRDLDRLLERETAKEGKDK